MIRRLLPAIVALPLLFAGSMEAFGQGMPDRARPLSRSEVSEIDGEIRRLSEKMGVSERALKNFVAGSKRDMKSLKGALDQFAAQLAIAQQQIGELRRASAVLPSEDRVQASVSIDAAQTALGEGNLDQVARLIAAYEERQAKRADDEAWRTVKDLVTANPAMPPDQRRTLVESYMTANAHGVHLTEAQDWLARLDAERALLIRSTPWLAGATMRELSVQSDSLRAVRFSKDSGTVFAGGADGTIRSWDRTTGRQLKTLSAGAGAGAVHALATSPDGRQIAASYDDGGIRIWDIERGKVRISLTGHSKPAQAIDWSHDGRRIASASLDTSVKLWNAANGRLVGNVIEPHPCSLPSNDIYSCTRYAVDRDTVGDVEFSSDDSQLIVAYLKDVRIVDLQDDKVRAKLPAAKTRSAGYWRDGSRYMTVGYAGPARVWNARTNREECTLSLSGSRPTIGAVGTDNTHWAIGTDDNLVILTDGKCQILASLEGHGFPVNALAFSSDGRTLASVADDGRLILWEDKSVRTGR